MRDHQNHTSGEDSGPTRDQERAIAWLAERYGLCHVGANQEDGSVVVTALTDDIERVRWLLNPDGTARTLFGGAEVLEAFIDSLTHQPASGEYPLCPLCGDPIDFCQGHGELGGA